MMILIEIIKEVLKSAIEGGLGYWIDREDVCYKSAKKRLNAEYESVHSDPNSIKMEDIVVEVLLNDDSIRIEDNLSDEYFTLDLGKLVKGIIAYEDVLMCIRRESLYDAIQGGRFNSEDADKIIEYSLQFNLNEVGD